MIGGVALASGGRICDQQRYRRTAMGVCDQRRCGRAASGGKGERRWGYVTSCRKQRWIFVKVGFTVTGDVGAGFMASGDVEADREGVGRCGMAWLWPCVAYWA